MKERAYILVKTQIDTDGLQNLVNKLSKHKAVKLVDLVFGVYDLVVIIEAKDQENLGRFILNELRSQPGVHETVTYLAIRPSDSTQLP